MTLRCALFVALLVINVYGPASAQSSAPTGSLARADNAAPMEAPARGDDAAQAAASARQDDAATAEAPARVLEPAPVDMPARVPLADNFSPLERVGLWTVAGVGAGLFVLQSRIVPQLGAPAIGGPGEIDRAVSDALYRDPDAGKFLEGAPDLFGQVIAPALAFTYYGSDAIARRVAGRGYSGDVNADHEFLALVEAYGVTLSLTQTVKFAVGRERPFYALGRDPSAPPDEETNLSFFSGHASSSFCLAAFVSRDVSDFLAGELLAAQDRATRLWVGRILPTAALYGVAGVVGYSRIADQKHYLSDVLVGAAVGALSGNLFYTLHFDGRGRPRWRHSAHPVQALLAPFPGGLALVGRY